jgi:hypothetical protein
MAERAWGVHHGDGLVARLRETGADMPWTYAVVEELSGFESVRSLFSEQEGAIAAGDVERIGPAYRRIRNAVTMTFPDGRPVPEFILHIHADGTARWRWQDA